MLPKRLQWCCVPLVGLVLLAALPSSAAAQTAGDCNWAGIYGPPVAISLFEGRYWDPLADNEVGFGFATERPTGYAGPGHWTVTIDWGDGAVESYGPGSTALGGPLPEGHTAPPVWLVHTYGATGTFNVHVTSSGVLNTHSDNSGENLPCSDDITWPVEILRIEVQPPPGSGAGGSGGNGGTATCPEAAGLVASARYWNLVAQLHRGRSVEAHRAVMDYWSKASAAFYAVLGIAAADLPGDAIAKGTGRLIARKETLDGYRQLWENSLNGKWPEISRQLRVLQQLRKFLKALGPIGKLDATLHAGESLYWLGLAAQQGVLRDTHDALADAALANAADDQRRASRACGKAGASAVTTAAKAKPYTTLSRPRSVKGLRLPAGRGMSRRTVRALNALLAGQERAAALAKVVAASTVRALAAERARKAKWQRRQLRHARATARRLASHLDAQERRRGHVAASLRGPAREARGLEIAEPAKLGGLLRTIGLPDAVTASLKRLGLRRKVARRMFTQPPAGPITVPSLADAVADPAGAARDRAWARELRAFAKGP